MTAPISRAFVEILPDLRQFTAGLRTGIQSMVNDFSRSANDTARSGLRAGEQFGDGVRRGVSEGTTRLRTDVNEDLNRIQSDARVQGEESGRSFGTGFKTMVLSLGIGFAIFAGLSRAASFAKTAIFGFNSTLQQSTIAFTTMLGSGQKARSFLDRLQQFAKTTPFEFQGLVQNAQLLTGMGISARDVIPDLTALGDSVASAGGSADVLNQTILAFAQTAAKGKVDMGNLNQLLQGGVPQALKILAAHFHTTTGNMVQMISAGKVSSDEALPALIQGIEHGTSATAALGGMMDKQSKTFQGALSNINDALTQSLAKAFRPFFNLASAGANKLATFLGSPKFAAFAHTVSVTMVKGMRVAGGAVHSLASNFSGLIGPLMQAFRELSPFHLIFDALKPVLPSLVNALRQFGMTLGDAVGPVLHDIAPLVQTLTELLSQLAAILVQEFVHGLNLLRPIIPQIVNVFGSLVKVINNFIHDAIIPALPAVRQIIEMLQQVGITITHALLPIMPKIVDAMKQLFNAIKPLIPVVLGLIQNALKILIPVLRAVLPPLVAIAGFLLKQWVRSITIQIKTITTIIQWLKDFAQACVDAYHAVVNAFNKVIDFFQAVGRRIANIFSSAISWLKGAGSDIVHGLLNGITDFFSNVMDWFHNLPGRVRGFVSNAANWLFHAGGQVIHGFIQGLKNEVSSIIDWFKNLPGHILSALGIHSPPGWAIKAGEWIVKAVLQGMKNLGTGALQWIENWAGDMFDKIANFQGPTFHLGGGTEASTSIRHLQDETRRILSSYGWQDSQWPALLQLWQNESGWRWNATNPDSGAYGIPQSLPASKMASAGSDWRTNPATQVRWGLGYIKERYGSPMSALSAWQSRSPHWYDKGKWEILSDELAMIHRGEMVVPADLAATIRRLSGRDVRRGTKDDPLTHEDRQFNRAVRLSRDLTDTWHTAVQNVNAFTRSLNDGVSAIRDSFKTLLQAVKASGMDRAGLDRLRDHEQRLLDLTRARAAVADQINRAQQHLNDLHSRYRDLVNSTRGSITGGFDITTAGTGLTNRQGLPMRLTAGTVSSSLQGLINQTRAFVRKIKKLVREGLPGAWVAQLVQQGPAAMGMVDALSEATPKMINQLRSQWQQLGALGTDLGQFRAGRQFGGDIRGQERLIDRLNRRENRLDKHIENLDERIARAIAHALAGMAIRFDGDGLARLVSKHQGHHATKGVRR